MTESLQIAIIAGLCAGLPPIIVSCINRIHVSRKINEVHVQINSRMDSWMAAAKALSHSEGKVEGAAEQKASDERDKLKGTPSNQ